MSLCSSSLFKTEDRHRTANLTGRRTSSGYRRPGLILVESPKNKTEFLWAIYLILYDSFVVDKYRIRLKAAKWRQPLPIHNTSSILLSTFIIERCMFRYFHVNLIFFVSNSIVEFKQIYWAMFISLWFELLP